MLWDLVGLNLGVREIVVDRPHLGVGDDVDVDQEVGVFHAVDFVQLLSVLCLLKHLKNILTKKLDGFMIPFIKC